MKPGRHDVAAEIRGMAARLGAGFDEPDADWIAQLFAYGATVRIFALAPDLFEPGATKAATWRWLPRLVASENVRVLGLVMSTWALSREDQAEIVAEQGPHANFGDHPNAREQLVVTAVDRLGEETWFAPIERHAERPPTLGRWERIDAFGGDVPRVLRSILRGDN